MGYSIKDLENAARSINQGLEQRSQERGEELANHVLERTAQGRGLWFIIFWPAWFLIFSFSGVLLTNLIQKLGVNAPISWVGMIGGLVFARAWYVSNFTIRHPFFSSVFGYFGTAFAVIFLADKIGI